MTPLKKEPLLPTVIATILAKEHKAILIASVWMRMCFTGIATNSQAEAYSYWGSFALIVLWFYSLLEERFHTGIILWTASLQNGVQVQIRVLWSGKSISFKWVTTATFRPLTLPKELSFIGMYPFLFLQITNKN